MYSLDVYSIVIPGHTHVVYLFICNHFSIAPHECICVCVYNRSLSIVNNRWRVLN